MNPLEQTRLEKALADHGFDLTPVLEGIWLVGRSTQHPVVVHLQQNSDTSITLSTRDGALQAAMSREDLKPVAGVATNTWEFHCSDYQSIYRVLGRYAALARSLPNRVADRFTTATVTLPQTTEAERMMVQRIGQNLFRAALIDYWHGCCAVTGLDVLPLLRASHIKPWAVCVSNEERLDVFNGLLLAPHLDALFDGGWISFTNDGLMLLCDALGEQARNKLGLSAWTRLTHVSEEHLGYLRYHRECIFKGKKKWRSVASRIFFYGGFTIQRYQATLPDDD